MCGLQPNRGHTLYIKTDRAQQIGQLLLSAREYSHFSGQQLLKCFTTLAASMLCHSQARSHADWTAIGSYFGCLSHCHVLMDLLIKALTFQKVDEPQLQCTAARFLPANTIKPNEPLASLMACIANVTCIMCRVTVSRSRPLSVGALFHFRTIQFIQTEEQSQQWGFYVCI